MRTIFNYDWKYDIAFDDMLYREVRKYSLKLNTLEREIMDEEIAFYRKHFSFEQVIKALRKIYVDEDRVTFLKKIVTRKKDIYYMPIDLRDYYLKIVEKEFKEYKIYLVEIINNALNQSTKNIYVPLYKSILGPYYKDAIKTLKRYAERVEHTYKSPSIDKAHLDSMARAKISVLFRDTALHRFWGRDYIKHDIAIAVEDKEGFGRWNPKEASYSKDKLYLYAKKQTELKLDFDLALNVYPGHAHFYNTVLGNKTEDIRFDRGASFLVNGWALFAGWHSKPSAYIRNMKKEYAILQLCLLNGNLHKAYKQAYMYLLQSKKYDQKSIMDYMINFTQTPGLFESYVLGALATESAIEVGFANNPEHYLLTLSEINCGDFFKIYTPKMQKKIAHTSITARVAMNFR
ncbi:MAG: hypothetical protein IJW28_02230 [Clostridia bacterium]|nr:hypothetical protein [Clostridia bacterium]